MPQSFTAGYRHWNNTPSVCFSTPVRTLFEPHPDGGVVGVAMTPDAKYIASLSAAETQVHVYMEYACHMLRTSDVTMIEYNRKLVVCCPQVSTWL